MADTTATAQTLSPAETAEMEALYATLKPEAVASARSYVLARTPAKYQEGMIALIAADFPPPAP